VEAGWPGLRVDESHGGAGLGAFEALQYYAGWARGAKPEEFPLAASPDRAEAGRALDFAARSMINVHGGIGATWEHERRCSSAGRNCRGGCWAGPGTRSIESPSRPWLSRRRWARRVGT